MQMRNEVNDQLAQQAFEGDDRDDLLEEDLEVLGGTTEDLEVSALRELAGDAAELAGQERGSTSFAIIRLSGALADNMDEPMIDELNRTEILGVLRFIARENPDALTAALARHPATEDMLADVLANRGRL